jgi:hypothetical protein
VCTGHCTVQCPVHRQPRAKIQFSCALSGGSPDSYCALSGVHRTGTVDCPVRPYRVLKKKASSPTEPEAQSFSPASRSLCLSGDSRSPAGDLPPPAATVSGQAPATHPAPLGEQAPLFPLLPSQFSGCGTCAPLTTPFCAQIQIPVKSSESKWWIVFPCVH